MAPFSFHRGSLALDFAGTVGRRASAPVERLPDPGALSAWLRAAGLTGASVAATRADLAAAVALREAIARTGFALHAGGRPALADVAAINAAAGAAGPPFLDPATYEVRRRSARPVAAALAQVAADAIELFGTRRDRLVRCELDGCGALLLSASRGAARRWCSERTCGNIARVAAHRARSRAGKAAATGGAPAPEARGTMQR